MRCCFGPHSTDSRQGEDDATATDILDKRFAAGEIGKDEYEDMKRTISDPEDSPNS